MHERHAPLRCMIFGFAGSCRPTEWRWTLTARRGTYIRTLCADIGKALGCGGHMAELLRTATGSFSLENAIKLDDLKALAEQERAEDALLTMQEALRDFPVIKLRRARPSCSITAEKYRKKIFYEAAEGIAGG